MPPYDIYTGNGSYNWGLGSTPSSLTNAFYNPSQSWSNPNGFVDNFNGGYQAASSVAAKTNPMNYSAQIENLTNQLDNKQNGGLLDQVNDFFGSNTFKGLMGIGSLAQGIFNGYMGYQAFKENKKNMELQRSIAKENQARQRHEWQRQDANRASISASWNR